MGKAAGTKTMNIYIDLDDTLIHSINGFGRNPGKRKVIRVGEEDEVYHSILRPEAGRLLSGLRTIGAVRMLTTATREYAIAHNKTFTLGFQECEIISRHDYICTIKLAYGSEWVPSRRNMDPGGILIDNLPINTESSRNKVAYLGIQPDRYFQIREFNGKDPADFSSEVDLILEQAKTVGDAVAADGGPRLSSPLSPNPRGVGDPRGDGLGGR